MKEIKDYILDLLAFCIVAIIFMVLLSSFLGGFLHGLKTNDCSPKDAYTYINIPWRLTCEMAIHKRK
jgi:hypothetical protein